MSLYVLMYRDGRDVKIDILEGYIRTSERFRVIRVFFGVPESYGNMYWALLGHTGKKEKGAAPLVQFGPEGGRMPPSFWPISSIPVWPNKAHILPGEFP